MLLKDVEGKKGGADYSEPKQQCSCIIFTNIYNIRIKKQPTWVLRILTFIGIYLSSPSAFLGSMPVTNSNFSHPVGPAENVQ